MSTRRRFYLKRVDYDPPVPDEKLWAVISREREERHAPNAIVYVSGWYHFAREEAERLNESDALL